MAGGFWWGFFTFFTAAGAVTFLPASIRVYIIVIILCFIYRVLLLLYNIPAALVVAL